MTISVQYYNAILQLVKSCDSITVYLENIVRKLTGLMGQCSKFSILSVNFCRVDFQKTDHIQILHRFMASFHNYLYGLLSIV